MAITRNNWIRSTKPHAAPKALIRSCHVPGDAKDSRRPPSAGKAASADKTAAVTTRLRPAARGVLVREVAVRDVAARDVAAWAASRPATGTAMNMPAAP